MFSKYDKIQFSQNKFTSPKKKKKKKEHEHGTKVIFLGCVPNENRTIYIHEKTIHDVHVELALYLSYFGWVTMDSMNYLGILMFHYANTSCDSIEPMDAAGHQQITHLLIHS